MANGHLAAWQAALAAESLGRRFEDQRMFGEDDDHRFRLPHRH